MLFLNIIIQVGLQDLISDSDMIHIRSYCQLDDDFDSSTYSLLGFGGIVFISVNFIQFQTNFIFSQKLVKVLSIIEFSCISFYSF